MKLLVRKSASWILLKVIGTYCSVGRREMRSRAINWSVPFCELPIRAFITSVSRHPTLKSIERSRCVCIEQLMPDQYKKSPPDPTFINEERQSFLWSNRDTAQSDTVSCYPSNFPSMYDTVHINCILLFIRHLGIASIRYSALTSSACSLGSKDGERL